MKIDDHLSIMEVRIMFFQYFFIMYCVENCLFLEIGEGRSISRRRDNVYLSRESFKAFSLIFFFVIFMACELLGNQKLCQR